MNLYHGYVSHNQRVVFEKKKKPVETPLNSSSTNSKQSTVVPTWKVPCWMDLFQVPHLLVLDHLHNLQLMSEKNMSLVMSK